MSGLRILVADDHALFRQGLRKLLEQEADISLIEEASDGKDALEKARKFCPDVVLLDLEMPNMDGLEALGAIRKSCPDVRIIMVTMHEDDRYLFDAIKMGANGYVLKDSGFDKLLLNVKAVARGEAFLNSSIARRIMDEFARLAQNTMNGRNNMSLTARETEILQCLGDGKSNRQIANKLFISEKTVKNHISNIFQKLHCNDRVQAVMEGMRLGLIEVEH